MITKTPEQIEKLKKYVLVEIQKNHFGGEPLTKNWRKIFKQAFMERLTELGYKAGGEIK